MAKSEFDVCNQVETVPHPQMGGLGRRDFLFRFGRGVGSLALSSLLFQDQSIASASGPKDPLIARPPHFESRAKSCIFLFMEGAPSQMDTFDPKPALDKFHGTPVNRIYGSMEKRLYVRSPFKFQRYGQSGMEVSEIFPHLSTCVDDLAVVRSLHTDSHNHPAGCFLMNTGAAIPGSPSLGSWLIYGLGNENQNF